MLNCISNCLARSILPGFVVAVALGILAGLIAAGGGIVIIAGPISTGVITSAIVAGIAVFGIVMAFVVLSCVFGCLGGARPPRVDEDPPQSGSGIAPGVRPPPDPKGSDFL